MYLHQIRIVDLNHSVWDREKSKPEKGEYEFSQKAYIHYGPEKTIRPAWWFTWVSYNPADGLRSVRDYQDQWKYSYVTKDDPYWPQGLAPDENGRYRYGDVVLMKCPLIEHLKKREFEKAISDSRAASTMRSFKEGPASVGAGLTDKDEEYLENLLLEFSPK